MPLLTRARCYRSQKQPEAVLTPFQQAVLIPGINQIHQALGRDTSNAVREARLRRISDRCIEQGPGALTDSEVAQIARDKTTLKELHRMAWRAPKDSYWGRSIQSLTSTAANRKV